MKKRHSPNDVLGQQPYFLRLVEPSLANQRLINPTCAVCEICSFGDRSKLLLSSTTALARWALINALHTPVRADLDTGHITQIS